MGPTGQAGGGWIAQTQHFHGKQGKARRVNATESFLQGRQTKGGEEEAEKQQQLRQNLGFKRKTAQKSPSSPGVSSQALRCLTYFPAQAKPT